MNAEVQVFHVFPSVNPKLLIEAADAVAARKGEGDATLTMIAHFNNRLPPEQLLAINYRLMALARLIQKGEGSAWVITAKGKQYRLVDQAMFRAAATTPLSIDGDEPVTNIAFDTDAFLQNALGETKTKGSA
jgi:hypothetical protein